MLGISAGLRDPHLSPALPYPYLFASSNRSRSAGIRGNQRASCRERLDQVLSAGHLDSPCRSRNSTSLDPLSEETVPVQLAKTRSVPRHCRNFVYVVYNASVLYIAAEGGVTLFRGRRGGDNFRNQVISGSSLRRESSLRSPHAREAKKSRLVCRGLNLAHRIM